MADAFPLLRRCHLFIAMQDAELRELATHFELVEVEADQYVFKQGDPADGFYMIQGGQVEVSVVNALTGKVRRLSTLVEGDYFGEMALMRHRPRSASVKALKPLKLWKLSQDQFESYVLGDSKVKPNLEVAVRSRRFARRANFKWLTPNEIVYLVTLRHPVFLLGMIWQPTLVMLGALVVGGVLFFLNLPRVWQAAPLLLIAGGLAWFYWNWVDFHNDWYVVTNQRVVDIDKVVLFYDSRAEAPLPMVQNTAIRTTELGRQLNYGDVIVNTFSGPVTLNNVPYPQAAADMILEQVNRVRVQQKMAERAALKSTLRLAMGIDKPPEKPAAQPPALKKRGPLWQPVVDFFRNFSLRVREQQGEAIVYHKHPALLAAELGPELGGILLCIVLGAVRLFAGFELVNAINIWVFLGLVLLLLLFLIGRVVYEYLDWKNDIYMVTSTQVLDIERKPFGNELRKAANLDAVTNIAFVRPGFIATLLNYGMVTINAGPGGEMKFFNVFDPMGVQQDIYRRKEARDQAKAAVATRQRAEEMGQYLSVFYEIMEDERKGRESTGS
ncbi:MAG TPA: cyclic nucleotide-binding domain-containing protein [Anaerolineales bacterium]|nr:cyclic nucleotide-binding domain-containing protein [Anaerolineales bacterium]